MMISVMPIHPFLRRAGSSVILSLLNIYDSSLLAKGRLIKNILSAVDLRFIPSYEGQTQLDQNALCPPAIHPLLRGADVIGGWIVPFFVDSSPPTRGRLIRPDRAAKTQRFIPSYEGQTPAQHVHCRNHAIHPLLRGADQQRNQGSRSKNDSSPPTRGRPPL